MQEHNDSMKQHSKVSGSIKSLTQQTKLESRHINVNPMLHEVSLSRRTEHRIFWQVKTGMLLLYRI